MAVTKAQQRATNKYIAGNYDRINLTLSKGQKEIIKSHAESMGESVNGFINRAIDEAMDRDRLEAGALETKELLSMPGISKKLVDGKNTPLSECVSESEAGW